MSGDENIRIGFIGAGGICRQRHLPGLAKIDDVQLVAVCNRSEASGRAVASEWNIPHVETDWRKLVGREDVDAVFIGTWPYMHCDMAVAALEAGKHVFCQARMANDLAQAQAMVDAAERHGELVNMICPPPHRMPWEPFIRKLVAEGELGEIREVRLVSVNDGNAERTRITWREQEEYSGKQALQLGIWAETLIAWLGEYETLGAIIATPIASKSDEAGKSHEIKIPQIVLVHGRLANGAVISEHHSGLSMNETANYLTIAGEKGTLRIDAMERICCAKAGKALEPIEVPGAFQRGWQVEEDFIAAVRAARADKAAGERPVSPDFAEGLKYMKKVEAVYLSAAAGRTVRLAEL